MQYLNHTDETLVLLTLAGEQKAYEALVTRHQKGVVAAAWRITRNQFMAEDAAQDAFVTAWMKLNTLREPEKYGAWVCRIAKNCALNMITRYRGYIDLDLVGNLDLSEDPRQNPAELYAFSEEKEELYKSLNKLPERVGQIIYLHYFEGLSVSEIADRMRISEGTVKWQLHDGRKRIRKDLCAMNEHYSDTLVQRVMKKVEELKLWQLKTDKTGFEAVYEGVLREVEDLPESDNKYHALADVLMRGWWWLPGDKNDALFARIREAAIKGKNDEVMEFIVSREDSQVYGGTRIDFMLNKQIPMLEKAGFTRALGREWFWLAYEYYRNGQPDKGKEAYATAHRIMEPSHAYRAMIPGALKMEEAIAANYKSKNLHKYRIGGSADEFRYFNGQLRYWNTKFYGEGYLYSFDDEITEIFRRSAHCDSRLFDLSLKPGEFITGTDGTTLTFVSAAESVETPAGVFEGCQLWVTNYAQKFAQITVKSYYKSGVGIVKHEALSDGVSDVRLLCSYHVEGGEGLLPLSTGNTWEYSDTYRTDCIRSKLSVTVAHADRESVILATQYDVERLNYDENRWIEMIEAIRNEYLVSDKEASRVNDVSYAIDRAKILAATPMEKAHTQAATDVVRRIMETDTTFNPNHTATGHWNFFRKLYVNRENDAVTTTSNYRYSFEWKNMSGTGDAGTPLLYNDVYGILEDATQYLWSDEWRIGAMPMVEYALWGDAIKTKIVCTDGGTVQTLAGTFDNCLKLSLDISGLRRGLAYRGGHKEYIFAPGVGIVRTVNEFSEGTKKAVYELTDYQGSGEGYMPMGDGMMRRYEAIGLTDGYVGAVEYTYVAEETGRIAIFVNQTGIRNLPPPITQYRAICYEVEEDKLWEAGKHEESRLAHAVNNFRLLLHFLGRVNRNLGAPESAVEWGKYQIRIIESLSENGKIPRAWLARYWRIHFATACALFGCNTPEKKEEGYRYLDRAFALYPEWACIPDGEALEVGNPLIYGDIKLFKSKEFFALPDGTLESFGEYVHLFNPSPDIIYYGMTATHGWEWFNPVREEERFKAYVERARALLEAK
ncbi:MAG: RNA polymerase sigma factor [Clostridia bacterium]|nr:RNA polymerase sigma factor [Clostridia bacterium]